MKSVLLIIAFCSFNFLFTQCTSNEKQNQLNSWIGNYKYEEEPVKANAGYSMVMVWEFSIAKENDSLRGILEINGQQTYIKVSTNIVGDSNRIIVTYNQVLDGFSKGLKKDDTLFTLSKVENNLNTTWHALESQLQEKSARQCNCFAKIQ